MTWVKVCGVCAGSVGFKILPVGVMADTSGMFDLATTETGDVLMETPVLGPHSSRRTLRSRKSGLRWIGTLGEPSGLTSARLFHPS